MLELGSSGSVRGVLSNEHPYREPGNARLSLPNYLPLTLVWISLPSPISGPWLFLISAIVEIEMRNQPIFIVSNPSWDGCAPSGSCRSSVVGA